MNLLTWQKVHWIQNLKQFNHKFRIDCIVPAEETVLVGVLVIFECQVLAEVMVKVMEQVISVEATLHVWRELHKQQLLLFIMDRIIVILIPLMGEEVLEV